MAASLVTFLSVSALVIATPGPDTAITVNGTVGGGRRGGVFTALGVSCGQAVWTLAASAGPSARPGRLLGRAARCLGLGCCSARGAGQPCLSATWRRLEVRVRGVFAGPP